MVTAERRRLPWVFVRGLWHLESPRGAETLCGWMTAKADPRSDRPTAPVCPSCAALDQGGV